MEVQLRQDVERISTASSSSDSAVLDFDEEAHRLWEELGLDGGVGEGHNAMDLMYRSQQGPPIFVGSEAAAKDLALLQSRGVGAVVNCTSTFRDFHVAKGIEYFHFDASLFSRPMNHQSDKACNKFLAPLIAFVDRARRLVWGSLCTAGPGLIVLGRQG